MPITEVKINTRSSVDDVFFIHSPITPTRQAIIDVAESLQASNRYTIEYTRNEDLVQISTATFADLDAYSQMETVTGIALDYEYSIWANDNNLNRSVIPNQYTQSGIDQAFTCTTTYSYPADVNEKYESFEYFIQVIEASDKLESFTNTGTQLITVHRYLNSADFTENHWRDYYLVASLFAAGVTRTITYALV